MDIVYKEADRFIHTINREKLKLLVQFTVDVNCDRQIFFLEKLYPICDTNKEEILKEIESQYVKFKERLDQLKFQIEKLDKQEKVDSFAREHFIMSVRKTNELYIFAHDFISLVLSDRIQETKISLEEILLRIQNNLNNLQAEYNDFLNELRGELYTKDKEMIAISRRLIRKSIDTAEVAYSIDAIRGKIKNNKYLFPIERVTEEVCYWKNKLREFNMISDCVLKLKAEQVNVWKQQETYDTLRSVELSGSKQQCWLNMDENLRKRHEFIKAKTLEVAKCLMTFFAIPGYDNVVYSDHIGHFFLDSFNHQVYVFNHELNMYHVNCNGDFEEVSDKEKYYFDVNGRFIKKENSDSKIYQCAPCTSLYKLGEDHLLTKITQDCGHSENVRKDCKHQVKTIRADTVILPEVKEIKNIKETLSPEVVKYLWNSYGHLLPEALHDTGRDQPRNPIQYFAHKILLHKYRRTFSELSKSKTQAEEYRTNVIKSRKEKAVIASKAWKDKQVALRKPESDDVEQQAVYNAYIAEQDKIIMNNDD